MPCILSLLDILFRRWVTFWRPLASEAGKRESATLYSMILCVHIHKHRCGYRQILSLFTNINTLLNIRSSWPPSLPLSLSHTLTTSFPTYSPPSLLPTFLPTNLCPSLLPSLPTYLPYLPPLLLYFLPPLSLFHSTSIPHSLKSLRINNIITSSLYPHI